MRQPVKELNMQATADAPLSALDDSGIAVRSPGLRFIFVPDLAEDALRRSGIERGMRVLELECGDSNASISIAKFIGPSGLLVGVDRSAEAIDAAERWATVAGCCYWTRFVTADPNTFVPNERFDVVVVRLTLLRQDERATLLRLSACVRPAGVVVLVSGKPAAKAPNLKIVEHSIEPVDGHVALVNDIEETQGFARKAIQRIKGRSKGAKHWQGNDR